MAEVLPVNFPIPQESAIATYNSLDLLQNTGTLVLYGATAKDDGTTNIVYFLTPNSNYASWLAWSSKVAGGSDEGVFSASGDFDFEVNVPIYVKGTGYAIIPIWTSGGTSPSLTMTLNLYHVTSGGTETLLATGTATHFGAAGSSLPEKYSAASMVLLSLDKKFGKGEKIRLSIDSATCTGTGSWTAYIGHDPVARDPTSFGWTPMQIQLPVKIT